MKFMASKNKVAWPRSACDASKLLLKPMIELVRATLYPLMPYESGPTEPKKELPEIKQNVSGEQMMQCQAIFDASEARRTHIEQKAQWLFTSIAFLMPALGSVFIFLGRDSEFRSLGCPLSLGILLVSACFLTLCFIAASRAMAVRVVSILHIHSVISKKSGKFLKYKKDTHAQGLLHCAIMNTATNDHIAQFVRSAQILLTVAVLSFVFGLVMVVYDPWCPIADVQSGGFEACALAPTQ